MISLIRIDDRLIHGQVMAVWARALRITHIIVADDEIAADAFARQIMRLAMPPSIALSIVGINNCAALLTAAQSDSSRTLVLLKSVASAMYLHDLFPLKELNVGGLGMAPRRKLVWKSIAASAEEIDYLRKLGDSGVDVYFQMVPGEARVSIATHQA